jgi:hypothetical protein
MAGLTPEVLVSLYESVGPGGDALPLKDLCSIDWSAFTHAHGTASDTPALLRALMSEDPDHRDFACKLLFETIWHQGDVYEATPLAVPFLFELLEADGHHDKTAVAHLLATIAEGHSPMLARCEGDSKEAEQWRSIFSKDGRPLEVEFARERRYMDELHRQLARRFDLLYPYPRHAEPEIRRSIAAAVGCFPEIAARLLPNLEAALQDESDKYVREALRKVIEGRTGRPT